MKSDMNELHEGAPKLVDNFTHSRKTHPKHHLSTMMFHVKLLITHEGLSLAGWPQHSPKPSNPLFLANPYIWQ